jgi:spore coat polysaccharide biosynthesis protein SpsF
MTTAVFITARLKSTRLSQKAVKPLAGKPMIGHLIERLRVANRPDCIVLCTSTVGEDDRLAVIAADEGIDCYRGDPEDVLLRLTHAAEAYGVDTVISCTADNPLTDPEYVDRLADFHHDGDYDYSCIKGLPFGTFSYGLSRPAMKKACEIKVTHDTEVWGGYFTETGLFDVGVLEVEDDALRRPDLRLTVDTPEDFALMERIYDELYDGSPFSLREVVRFLDENPDLVTLNRDVEQKAAKGIKVRDSIAKNTDA